ncbi:hypothetical protein [Sphingomonas aerolata]|uniref:hypothetical protein n=1 Tax=Sphingomonas aerolata TaxID=185951 RepID=UPI002FDF31D4
MPSIISFSTGSMTSRSDCARSDEPDSDIGVGAGLLSGVSVGVIICCAVAASATVVAPAPIFRKSRRSIDYPHDVRAAQYLPDFPVFRCQTLLQDQVGRSV